MADNHLVVTVLNDGSIRVETDAFIGAAHGDAESLLAFLAEELGGEVSTEKRKNIHHHHHEHDHHHGHGHNHHHAGH